MDRRPQVTVLLREHGRSPRTLQEIRLDLATTGAHRARRLSSAALNKKMARPICWSLTRRGRMPTLQPRLDRIFSGLLQGQTERTSASIRQSGSCEPKALGASFEKPAPPVRAGVPRY